MKSINLFRVFFVVTGFISVECNLIRQLHAEENGNLRLDSMPNCSRTGEGYFPNDKDCTRYYRCVNESRPVSSTVTVLKRYDFVCGSGTVYDPSQYICTTFGNVNSTCNGKDQSGVTMTPSGMSTMNEENSSSRFKCPIIPLAPSCPFLKCSSASECESFNPCKPDEHCCSYQVSCDGCQNICYKKNMSTS